MSRETLPTGGRDAFTSLALIWGLGGGTGNRSARPRLGRDVASRKVGPFRQRRNRRYTLDSGLTLKQAKNLVFCDAGR